jgi:erythromycin esterase-like protein
MVEPGSSNQPAIALMSREAQARAIAKLEALHAFMRDHRADFLKRSSEWDYGIALLYTRLLVQGGRMHADFGVLLRAQPGEPRPQPRFTEGNYRDRMMAENVEAQLRLLGPNARMMIWAHNMHVAVETNYGGGLTLGYHLRQSLGSAYYAIGVTFNEGSFQIIDLKRGLVEFTVPPAPAGSVPWAFATARAEQPYRDYFVDFRPIPRASAARRWLDAPQLQYYVGSGFSNPSAPRYLIPSAVGQQYDGMIFIDKTTRARPNPTGQRPPQ